MGEPGDDVLVGPDKIHELRDTYRTWLDANPAVMESIREESPTGPLCVSHRTGKRTDHPGTPRRYDAIWASDHFEVLHTDYHYTPAIEAGSDHALVAAELKLTTI